jgi:hypothetical protein
MLQTLVASSVSLSLSHVVGLAAQQQPMQVGGAWGRRMALGAHPEADSAADLSPPSSRPHPTAPRRIRQNTS